VIIVFSHWGKVSAAMTATSLITEFGVDSLVFTGVAGGVDPSLRVGDIVVATSLVQHDMDARPLFSHHEIPLLNRTFIETDPNLRQILATACHTYLACLTTDQTENLRSFGIVEPRIVEGVIASGDKFFASKADLQDLRSQLPEAVCVEMEGAAVAQVCSEYGIPYAVVRTISDSANDAAVVDFVAFIQSIARAYSFGIMQQFLMLESINLNPCMSCRHTAFTNWL
jgi:adenosylhomocysteine nucleosidase